MDAMPNFDRRPSGKVLFAEDFDQPLSRGAAPEPEVIEPTFSAAELEAARAEAWQAGSDEAAVKAAAADHAAIRQAVAAIAAQLAAAHDACLEIAEQSAAMIARLLLHSLGAVLPQLAARYGEAELLAIIRIVTPGLFKEPAITVRAHPRHCAALIREIESLDPDLAARMQVIPTDAMPPGDLRVSWRNGGAIRDTAALWAQVSETLGLAGLAPEPFETRELEHAG